MPFLIRMGPTDLNAKGESHALYNCWSTGSVVVAGIGDRIHGGIFYSHPAGRCRCHGAAQPNSREEISIEGRGRRQMADSEG